MWDVIIAGAGIIGVSLALELRERGAKVLVFDRGRPGRESSSAAAGMLAPSDPETPGPLRLLAAESARLFPAFVRKLESLSEIQVDFRPHVLEVGRRVQAMLEQSHRVLVLVGARRVAAVHGAGDEDDLLRLGREQGGGGEQAKE